MVKIVIITSMYLNPQYEKGKISDNGIICLNTHYAIDTSHTISLLFITFQDNCSASGMIIIQSMSFDFQG